MNDASPVRPRGCERLHATLATDSSTPQRAAERPPGPDRGAQRQSARAASWRNASTCSLLSFTVQSHIVPNKWIYSKLKAGAIPLDLEERSARGRALFPPSGVAFCWRLDAAITPATARAVPKPPIAFGAARFLSRAASLSCSAGGLRSFPSEK